MREQAHVIQKEVTLLMEDIFRLDERVQKLTDPFPACCARHRADPDLHIQDCQTWPTY